MFHTYWTGVTDVDQYRQTVKEEIINWLAMLRKTSSFTDWMIILVETPEEGTTHGIDYQELIPLELVKVQFVVDFDIEDVSVSNKKIRSLMNKYTV